MTATQPSLPFPQPKRATRYKIEVVTIGGVVVWEALARDTPPDELRRVLSSCGYVVRRASTPKTGPAAALLPLTYSTLDPEASIAAAYEHHDRHATQWTNVLCYLIEHERQWIPRDTIRLVGGDSGDKRVRDLRQINWPIEIAQITRRHAWHVRLNMTRG